MGSITTFPLKLYGVPLSQPFRSCAWTMLLLKLPFQIEMVVPGMAGKVGTKSEAFQSLTRHKSSTVPLLVDDNASLVLSESPAIMTYLCERYGNNDNLDLYASSGTVDKALIDSYLHWHHENTRLLARLFQKVVRPDLTVCITDDDQNQIQEILKSIDSGWLQSRPFIGNSETPSIADILAYCELSTVIMTNLLSLDGYENLVSWTERMQQLPFHDDAHTPLTTLGDVTIETDVPIAKRLGLATKAGIKAYVDAQKKEK